MKVQYQKGEINERSQRWGARQPQDDIRLLPLPLSLLLHTRNLPRRMRPPVIQQIGCAGVVAPKPKISRYYRKNFRFYTQQQPQTYKKKQSQIGTTDSSPTGKLGPHFQFLPVWLVSTYMYIYIYFHFVATSPSPLG